MKGLAWMRGCAAVAWREWRTAFVTPLGWCVLAAFTAFAGTIFAVAVFQSGAPATLRGVFIAMGWGVLAVAPALSMRSIAEERRHGTWALLAAAPAGPGAAVVGKFIAALGFLMLVLLVPTGAQLAALEFFARPDYGEAATALLGLLLAGAAYLASGILMSALTGSQVGAYLLTLFLWLTWIVLAKAAPAMLGVRWAYVAYGLDPLRRMDDFLLGVLDSGNAIFFVCVTGWFLAAVVVAVSRPGWPAHRGGIGRVWLTVAAAGALALGVAGAANAPAVRVMLDMTKTRAYTLTPRTQELLRDLQESWHVAVVLNTTGVDPAVLRQVDEVLARMEEASGGTLQGTRVDPTDPADAGAYERLLEVVQARDQHALDEYERAIQRGLEVFERLTALAGTQQAQLEQVIASLDGEEGLPSSESATLERIELESLRAAFAQLTAAKGAFLRSIRELRTVDDVRPFPDQMRAASAIADNLEYWGEQLQAVARSLSQRRPNRARQPVLAAWADEAVPAFMAIARQMRVAQDALEQLPPLHGARVGAALAAGDAGIVIGPPGVAVIPGVQLVAGAGARGPGAAVAFDRRFRGEQLVAAAIRGLTGSPPPVAVLVHAGPSGLLRPRPDHADFSAAADALRSARIDVLEWVPGEGREPLPPPGRTLVWVIVPPADRDGINEHPRERELLAAAERLIARGEPVLLSVGPSLLPLLGQRDPWAEALAARGLRAGTGRSVLEVVPLGPGKAQTVVWQSLRAFNAEHPVGHAVTGQLTRLDRVVPVENLDPQSVTVLAAVEPSAERWIESDWRRDQRQRLTAPEGKTFDTPVPVVAAAEGSAAGGRPARALLVGSPTWLLTGVMDVADALGGGRVALRNPGNRELLVNGVAWLAGREDLVAGTGAGREISRLDALSPQVRGGVVLVQTLGLPLLLAMTGAVVVLRRRWRT